MFTVTWWMPSKPNNNVQQNHQWLCFESWWHTALHHLVLPSGLALWDYEHGVACSVHHISYVCLRKNCLRVTFGEVFHEVSMSDMHSRLRHSMFLKLHTKVAPGWKLIWVNFDPMEEIGPKVGGGCTFMSGPSIMRPLYIYTSLVCFPTTYPRCLQVYPSFLQDLWRILGLAHWKHWQHRVCLGSIISSAQISSCQWHNYMITKQQL